MATLTIRNIPDDALAGFRVHAASHGRSMEAAAREMIEAVAKSPSAKLSVAERIAKAQQRVRDANGGIMPTGVVDEFLAERRVAAARGE